MLFFVIDIYTSIPKNIVIKAPSIPKVSMPNIMLPQFQIELPKVPQILGTKTSPSSQNPTQQVIDAVGKLMKLPTNEQPMVATVTDPAQLQGQEFFKPAIQGDKLLVYKNAQLAILYRLSENKIINVTQAEFKIKKVQQKNLIPQMEQKQSSEAGKVSITP